MVPVIINLFFWVKTTTFHKVLTKSTLSQDPTQERRKIVNDTIETFHCQQVLAKHIADNKKNNKCKNTSLLRNT